MCDSAAPGTRTGSARDIVSPSAPDRPRTRERGRTVSSRRERAAPRHLRSHTAITGKIGPGPPGHARGVWPRHGAAHRVVARQPDRGNGIAGLEHRRQHLAFPELGVGQPTGSASRTECTAGTAAAPRKSASGWHSTRTTVSPESKRPSPGTAWPRPRPGLSRDGTVAGALVPPVDVVAHARGLPVVALAVAARRPAALPGRSRGQGGADINKP